MEVEEATSEDWGDLWPVFHSIVARGDTYAYSPETSKEEGRRIWLEVPHVTYIAKIDGKVVGTYYIKANQPGLGSHVCNAGYMVAEEARGQGVATKLCLHSQERARFLGYQGMQFNLVVASNKGALRLWQKLGFEIIGRLPKSFRHRQLGLTDAFILYKWLEE